MEANYGCYASEWFLISETKGDLKCRTIGGIFLLFIQLGIQDSKENWRARQKSIYRIYIYCTRDILSLRLHISRATSFVDSVNSSERVRGIIG